MSRFSMFERIVSEDGETKKEACLIMQYFLQESENMQILLA